MASPHTKKILIVPHYYPPHLGGIEFVAQNQAERLAALGHQVTVVTSSVAANQRSGTHRGVHVIRIKCWNFLEKHAIPFPIFSPRLLPVIWRETGAADVVHIHDVFYISSLVAAVCAVWRKKPIVLTQHVAAVPHSALINLAERAVYATAGAYIFRRAARIMTLNDRVENFVRSFGVKPQVCRFVPVGTDCQLFRPATAAEKRAQRQKFGLPQDRPVVLFVGRAVPKKGFDKVLAAQSADYLLVFAGGAFTQSDSETAKFLGQVPQTTMAEIYRTADVYILPSEGEGFPMTAQEAMASGLPVVLKDEPGYQRYELHQDFVYLLQSRQPTVIKRTLQSLLQDAPRRRRMGRQARAFAQSHFAWDQLVMQLEQIYDEALQAGGAKR